VDEPFWDRGLDFARRRFFDTGICLLPVESFDLGDYCGQVAHTIGHEDRTHEHRPQRKFTPLDLRLIVDHGSRFESTKPTGARIVRAPKEA
jgi:hypothetical protein